MQGRKGITSPTRAQTARATVKERELQDAVVEMALLLGYLVYHTHDSRHSAKGFPDLVLCKPRRLIFAELKDEHRAVTKEQEQWLEALRACGLETWVWRPESWTSGLVEQVLRKR